jgi:two-component system, NtrC family, response regulator
MILSENNIINVKALPFCQKSCQNPREKGFSTLEELERSHISMVMHAVQGNKSRAAQVLGIGRKTLYRKLEEYRLTEVGVQEGSFLSR